MRYEPDSRLIRANFAVLGQKPCCRVIRESDAAPEFAKLARDITDCSGSEG